MANSKYEYVKLFEKETTILPETNIVIRIDGRGFHKLSAKYNFDKPNDRRALDLMNAAALDLMKAIPDILLAYGDSDEYSFLLRKNCDLFERREFKLITTFSSTFTAFYMHRWSEFFKGDENKLDIERLPTFDARAVVYPNPHNVRDYFAWRQVDCHINNLYNTTFWALVLKLNMTTQEAENRLMGTVSSDKNEILFSDCGINYNNEPEIYKKGSVWVRELVDNETSTQTSDDSKNLGPEVQDLSKRQRDRLQKKLKKSEIKLYHCDIIKEDFWNQRPWLLK